MPESLATDLDLLPKEIETIRNEVKRDACSECFDWHRNPLNPLMVTAENPICPSLRGAPRCVRFPVAAAEGTMSQ